MKVALSVLTFLIIIGEVNAQTISFGFKGGLNLANQDMSGSGYSFPTESLLGYHAGIYATSMFASHMGIQCEVLYSSQGSKVNYAVSGAPLIFTEKYSYLNVPVLFRVNVVPAFNIHFGPQLGFCLAAARTYGNGTMDIKSNVKTTDYALAMGMGFDAGLINGGVRYNLGLADISETSTAIKNNVFQLYVGVRLLDGSK